jgi:protein CpxP
MMKHRLPRFIAVGAALAIGLFASTVDAQGRPKGDRGGARGERVDPAQRLEQRVSLLTERLQLNASQQTQVRSILTEELNAMQAFRSKRGDGAQRQDQPEARAQRDSARTQMRALRERTEQRINGVLSEQQRTKYEELRQSMQERRGRGGETRPRAD